VSKIVRRRIDNGDEKKIIGGLISNTEYLRQLEPIIDFRLFNSKTASKVARWCMDYFQQYKTAAREHIIELWEASADTVQEEEHQTTGEFIQQCLEYELDENSNVAFLSDEAEIYFKLRQVEKLRDVLTNCLVAGSAGDAEKAVAMFHRIEKPSGVGIDVLSDRKEIYDAFDEDDKDSLFSFPGRLGDVIGQLSREDFLSITAPMKRGKTWWLIWIATIALMNKYRVLFVSMEMSQKQMVRRIYSCMTGKPLKSKDVSIPFFTDKGDIDYKSEYREGIKFSTAMKKAGALSRMIGGEGKLKLMTFPTRSKNVYDLDNEIEQMMYYENFVPDVIVVDYADILAPEPGASKDTRHRLDETWGALRGLAQARKALVVTGSQSTRGTLSKDITQEDVAEDIRKLAHVTHMVALNQTADNKRQGVMRVGMLANRHDEFFVDSEVVCLQQLSIGRPYLDSRTKKELGEA
jgi:hypothetical protein